MARVLVVNLNIIFQLYINGNVFRDEQVLLEVKASE
jgi:hypothetical protein